ncbi:hypothetical protein D3C80_1787290 [compost metagenome]
MEHAPFAQRVAGHRWLDLDNVGTELGEDFGCKWASNQLPHFDDLDALQWESHGVIRSC